MDPNDQDQTGQTGDQGQAPVGGDDQGMPADQGQPTPPAANGDVSGEGELPPPPPVTEEQPAETPAESGDTTGAQE